MPQKVADITADKTNALSLIFLTPSNVILLTAMFQYTLSTFNTGNVNIIISK